MNGNGGRDVIIGGTGGDVIHGDNLDDLLIAGRLAYASESNSTIDQIPLDAIMAEWRRTDHAYSLRVSILSVDLLSSTKVFDDGDIDSLFGDAGQDWYFAGDNDVVKSSKGETES